MASNRPKPTLQQVKALAHRAATAPNIYDENEADIELANLLNLTPPERLTRPQKPEAFDGIPNPRRRPRTSLAWAAARITTKREDPHTDEG